MATIERDVSLLQRRRVAPIYIVYGSAVQIRLNMIDYTIPANATVEFFAQCGSGPVYRCGGSASGNSAIFTPTEGFFQQGDNALQLEINGRMIPLALDVKCEERISGVGSEETPEQVRPLVLQAQDAAKEASSAATRSAGSASAAAGSASAAAGSADAAGKSAADALQSKNAAASSASSAGQSANAAAGSASAALGSQNAAAGSAQAAEASKNAAANSADSASGSASSAAGSASAAAGSAREALESKNAAAGSAQAAQEALEKNQAISVKPTYIGDNGNWFVWDVDQGSYVDSGVKAQGPEGRPGAVQTVCGVNPGNDGNVVLTATDVGAVTKEYADASVRKAAPRNLLDNSDFRNPVNQRGKTSYTNSGYTIDRWYLRGSYGLTVDSDNGISVPGGSDFSCIMQSLENGVNRFAGKTLTLAALVLENTSGFEMGLGNGTSSSVVGTAFGRTTFRETGICVVRVTIPSNLDNNYLNFFVGVGNASTSSDSSLKLAWCALYEGEYTAETLPEYQPKGYGAELAECQRYCLVIDYSTNNYISGYGTVSTTTRVNAYFPLPVPMRTTPSLSSTDGSVWAVIIDGTGFIPTEASIWFMSVNAILGMRFSFSTELGLKKTGIVNYNSATKLILSADL